MSKKRSARAEKERRRFKETEEVREERMINYIEVGERE